MNPHIVVVGSINIDMVIRCPQLPAPGQTILGRDFVTLPGGKGANQAVAAARLGAHVSMVGCVGDDDFGRAACRALAAENIDIAHVQVIPGVATGVAMVLVADDGENSIALALGANAQLAPAHVSAAASVISSAAMVLAQLETPHTVMQRVAELATVHRVPFLLNPAPALSTLEDNVLRLVDTLVPNESEASALTGIQITDVAAAKRAAQMLQQRGPANVLLTLGAHGVVSANAQGTVHWPAAPVKAVDTTGAGDTFIGALAVARARQTPLDAAIAYAQLAAGFSVQQRGAQASMPRQAQLPLLDAATESAALSNTQA